MTELGPAPAAIPVEEIIARWGKPSGPLDELVKAAHEPAYELERLTQLREARRNWRMVQADQFLSPDFVNNGSNGEQYVDFVTVDGSNGDAQTGAQTSPVIPLNFLGGDLYKYVAVMGQSAPHVKAVADDPTDNDELRSSTEADAVLREAWAKLLVDQLWRVIAFHQYTTGPTFIHTPFVTDRLKYGETTEPKVELVDDGSGNQEPQQVGVQTYPNGDVECHVCSVLEVTVPYGAKQLEDCGSLDYEYMESKYKLLAAFPEQLDKYRTTDPPDDDFDAASVEAATARDSVSNPSGVGRPKSSSSWRFRQLFRRPWMFEAITDKDARETLKCQYPDGICLIKVGSLYMTLEARPIDDEWAVCKTGRGEKIIERPICSDGVPFQRAVNDLGNLALETVLRSIAKTIVDQMLLDRKSIAQNDAVPAEMIFTTMPLGSDISKMIAQIPPARVSDQLKPLLEWFRAAWQDISGIRPELSGGGVPTQTYREAKQRKDQALMQLAPQAAEMQYAAARAGENIVRQRARYGSGTIKAKRKTSFGTKMDSVNLAQLADTGWHCEADDNFPMTTADTFDKLYGLLKEFSPEVAQQLSILDPMNQERLLELLQLPGFESTFEDQKQKTLKDIEQLMQGQPMQDADPDGQPGPPQPSIPIDQYDDHGFVADFVRKWMVSRDGQDGKQQAPQGFANVDAFQQAHQQLAQPQQPAPPPVRAGLNFSAKLEDFPGLVGEVMQGAGLPAPPPGAEQALLPPPKEPPKADLGAPAAPEAQESPLPEMPTPPSGPSPMSIQ